MHGSAGAERGGMLLVRGCLSAPRCCCGHEAVPKIKAPQSVLFHHTEKSKSLNFLREQPNVGNTEQGRSLTSS